MNCLSFLAASLKVTSTTSNVTQLVNIKVLHSSLHDFLHHEKTNGNHTLTIEINSMGTKKYTRFNKDFYSEYKDTVK